MISVIISTYRTHYLNNLKKNIQETIGVPYEIIAIENPNNLSLAICYNQGAEKAKYQILCFLHEDIIIKTNNWGIVLYDLFHNDPLIGLVGVAGVKYKTQSPSPLWNLDKSSQVINIIHTTNSSQPEPFFHGWDNTDAGYQDVIMVDGVILALRKETGLKFNTKIPGFHCYDMSISMECTKYGYKVVVTREILIEHFSMGNVDKSWIVSAHIFHKLYWYQFQSYFKSLIKPADEIQTLKNFILFSAQNGFIKVSIFWWLKVLVKQPTSGFHLLYLNQLLKSTKKNNG